MEQAWLNAYPEGIPADIDADKYPNIVELLKSGIQKYPNKAAFIHRTGSTERRVSFRELDELSDNFAAYLQHFTNLAPGDRIAIQMPNLLQYPVALFGALKAGLTVVNTNPLYTEREMEHQFRDADVKGLVILNMFAHKLEQVLPLTNIETLIIATPSELYPWPKNMIFDAAAKYVMGMVPKFELVQGYVSFSETLKAGASKALEPVNTQPGDIAFLQYTGGTTGFPKGAILTHRNIIANVEQIGAWMSTQLREGEEFIVTPLPLYHVFALTVNLLVFITYGGENLLISNPRDLDTSLGIMNQYKFTAVTGVNTLFRAMLDHP
jgi:long-chain acyl-CoA synthetase